MKRALIFGLLLVLAACTSQIATVEDAYTAITDLDSEYGTSLKDEKVNVLMMNRQQIASYINDIEALKNMTNPATEDDERLINLLYAYREQSLQSQYLFQEAWLGIGADGRVSDGFACSHHPKIREATMLLEESIELGKNATMVMDTLLTESPYLQENIGVGEEKPQFYESNFDQIYKEVGRNVLTMRSVCDEEIPTSFNFTARNQSEVQRVNVNQGT